MPDQPAPPILTGPPWSHDFLAALHAGCYDVDLAMSPDHDPVAPLWAAARADPVAAAYLDELDTVRAALIRLGARPQMLSD